MPDSLGGTTMTIFQKHESHKLHHEFQASADIATGQACKLHTDGTIRPIAAGEAGTVPVIGYATHKGKNGQYVTLVVRGFILLSAYSGAAITPGMAKVSGTYQNTGIASTENTFNAIVQATSVTDFQGWCLDSAGAANGLVRFLAKN